MLKLVFTLFLSLPFLGVWADECPYSMKDASVMLTLPSKMNLKITSSYMCNQKEFFADRFLDAEVEVWKMGKLVGKFYSRKVIYDMSTLNVVLHNSILLEGALISNKKMQDNALVYFNLNKNKMSTSHGEVLF